MDRSFPPGETVENDVLLNGNDLRVDGTVAGDVFAFGRFVVINGHITGSLFVVAEEVVINGQVEGNVYGLTFGSFQLSESGTIDHSLYYIGVSLLTARDSTVGRDLNALTFGARQRGNVGRNQNTIVGIIEIGKLIFEWINELNTGKSSASTAVFDELASRAGSFVVSGSGTTSARIVTAAPQPQTSAAQPFLEGLSRYFQGLLSFLLVGGLAIWLIPQPFTSWSGELQARPLPAFGWGLVVYIIGFVGVVILSLVVIAIGISLGFLSLWPLAFTWLGLALSSLGVSFWTFILFLAFMSKAVVAYVFGPLVIRAPICPGCKQIVMAFIGGVNSLHTHLYDSRFGLGCRLYCDLFGFRGCLAGDS